ncbi:MAG TPA: DinB family protein [Ktedonobacteraceae bacterium]|nr:DinB family protein [Ktedonobacteraceae bacterium]HYB01641.1 DinB family protein [Ktedonobacteraceae bacterium]
MSETSETMAFFIQGWQNYQNQLSIALARLSPDQLALRAAPDLRSIDELARHIIAVRAGWFHYTLEEGDEGFGAFHVWDEPDSPQRSASELVSGLEKTWHVMQEVLGRYTLADLQSTVQDESDGQIYTLTRGWVIWHVIEHDLHHGGEIAYSLGMHGLTAPDI